MTLNAKQTAILPAYTKIFTADKLKPTAKFKGFYVIVSKTLKSPFVFDSLTLSLSAKLDKDSAVLVEAAVKTEKGWSGLYKIFYLSNDYKKTFKPQKDTCAAVDCDVIKPVKGGLAYKYQITVLGKAKLNFLTAAFTKAGAPYDPILAQDTLELKDFEIPLSPVCREQYPDKNLRGKICSPCALKTVLDYYGKKVPLQDVVKGVYDQEAKICGTWPLNTAFASQQGLAMGVVRCCSLAQAEGELYKGRPLIVSIAYKEGKLKNAAVKSTEGHLVVICGIDKQGDIIVMDSAAKDEKSVRRIYNRKQFAAAWLKNKKGIAYAIGE